MFHISAPKPEQHSQLHEVLKYCFSGSEKGSSTNFSMIDSSITLSDKGTKRWICVVVKSERGLEEVGDGLHWD